MTFESVQNLCWLMIIGDYTTQHMDEVCVRFVRADPRFDKDIHIDAADIAPTVAGTQFVSQLDEMNLQVVHHSFKIGEGLLLITTTSMLEVCYTLLHYVIVVAIPQWVP